MLTIFLQNLLKILKRLLINWRCFIGTTSITMCSIFKHTINNIKNTPKITEPPHFVVHKDGFTRGYTYPIRVPTVWKTIRPITA